MKKVIVVGDLIHDYYIYGSVSRISPEFPIPIFKEHSKELKLGGAGNVYNNLKAFENDVVFYCQIENIPIKTRYVSNQHLMFRSDNETYIPYEMPNIKTDDSSYAILSDYNKGFLHNSYDIVQFLNSKNVRCIVDPKKPISNYKNCFLIKFNSSEYVSYTDETLDNIMSLHEKYNIPHIVVTMGKEGVLYSNQKETLKYKEDVEQVSDVTGAGDVFIASLTHYLNLDEPVWESIVKATKLATLSVSKFGTYVLTKKDIESINQKIIFTNGCFDILHFGHVEYLRQSKELGDKLIVGLNSDISVKKIKGLCRPINKQEDRMAVLKSLKFVDEVIVFDEETPYELIKRIKPDIITKGGDYSEKEVVGNDLAKVIIIPTVKDYSTTKVIDDFSDRSKGVYWSESSVFPRRFRRTNF